jgi:proton-dependent oligopeptide transporter, POT family
MVEQLNNKVMHVETLRSGERVIVDPSLTTQRIFMYFYLFINIGSIVGQISMVYAERYVGFWLSFTLPTIMFMVCPLVLITFKKKYNLREPTGSVLGKSMQLIGFALKGKTSANPVKTYVNML